MQKLSTNEDPPPPVITSEHRHDVRRKSRAGMQDRISVGDSEPMTSEEEDYDSDF